MIVLACRTVPPVLACAQACVLLACMACFPPAVLPASALIAPAAHLITPAAALQVGLACLRLFPAPAVAPQEAALAASPNGAQQAVYLAAAVGGPQLPVRATE